MKENKIWGIIIYFTVLAFMILFFEGCNDLFVISNPPDINRTSVSLKNDQSLNTPLNVITIDDAKALITELEVETGGTIEDKEITVGPFVVHFILDGTIQSLDTGSIPDGKFTKIKFKIHKPDDNESPSDPEFKDGASGNQRYSFIIKGKFNGNPFVYKSRQSVGIIINLDSDINLANKKLNITVLFNAYGWFLSDGVIIDPRDPNNANVIDNNIKNSFRRAFKDDDKNGVPDDH